MSQGRASNQLRPLYHHHRSIMLVPQTLRRITKEVARLQRSPLDGIAVECSEQDICQLDGWIEGPRGTPYEGGFFRVNLNFNGTQFPAQPPKCTMKTKIFHPNIAAGTGEICVSTLKRDWNPTYGIQHILTVIRCLLVSPNPDSALEAQAAHLLQEAYSEYEKTAQIWTRVHASVRPKCMPTSAIDDVVMKNLSSSTKRLDIADDFPLGLQPTPLTRSGSQNANLRLALSSEKGSSFSKLPNSLSMSLPSQPALAITTNLQEIASAVALALEMQNISLKDDQAPQSPIPINTCRRQEHNVANSSSSFRHRMQQPHTVQSIPKRGIKRL